MICSILIWHHCTCFACWVHAEFCRLILGLNKAFGIWYWVTDINILVALKITNNMFVAFKYNVIYKTWDTNAFSAIFMKRGQIQISSHSSERPRQGDILDRILLMQHRVLCEGCGWEFSPWGQWYLIICSSTLVVVHFNNNYETLLHINRKTNDVQKCNLHYWWQNNPLFNLALFKLHWSPLFSTHFKWFKTCI